MLGKAVLANVNSGQAVLGNTPQAISQPSFPSAQVAGTRISHLKRPGFAYSAECTQPIT